jgi:hypothetical protein
VEVEAEAEVELEAVEVLREAAVVSWTISIYSLATMQTLCV